MKKDDFQNDLDYAYFVTPTYDCYEDDEVSPSKMPGIDNIKKEHDVDTSDQYVGAHVRVPIGDEIQSGKADMALSAAASTRKKRKALLENFMVWSWRG
jgi:hypothetical protein